MPFLDIWKSEGYHPENLPAGHCDMASVLIIKCWNPVSTDRSMIPPLGAMYLASILRQAGHEVRILHVGKVASSRGDILAALTGNKPDVIGISAVVHEYTVFRDIVELLQQTTPEVPIMAGGPLTWSNPLAALQTAGVRVIAIGEADRTIVELVDALVAGGDLAAIPGAAVLRDGELVRGPVRELLSPAELDALPMPAWDLMDLDEHFKYRGMASVGMRRYMQVVTSRGCPYHCVYCHGMMGRGYRPRSPESVLEELRILREEYDIHEFEVVDDCFNLDRDRMHRILKGLIDFNDPALRLQFPSGLRSDLLTAEDIDLLRRAGTNFVSFAIETASPRLQKMIKKNLNIPRALQSISMASKAGIFCNGFFMLGFPTETAEECQSTIDLAVSTDLHEALFFAVSPFKGTEMFDMALQHSGCDASAIALDNLDFFNVGRNLSAMTDLQFERMFTGAYKKFYFSPRRAMRIFLRHPRKWQLLMYGPQILNKSIASLIRRHDRQIAS